MAHGEPEVRIAGLFLSVYSVSVTRPISVGVLSALRRNLVHLHADTDAFFRREVLGNTQKLFDRLRASTATVVKAKSKLNASSGARLPLPTTCLPQTEVLRLHAADDLNVAPLSFVVWYLGFLEWEMRPTASYQRRITALRSLAIVLRSGLDAGVPFAQLSKSAQGQLNWVHGIEIANPRLIRLLLDLTLDPFDDVRDAAVSILQLCLIALPDDRRNTIMATIPGYLERAEAVMLRTGRADQADGVARAYGLIFSLLQNTASGPSSDRFTTKLGLFEHLHGQLYETLELARTDLSEAVNGRPVHGTFAALRYIVDQPDFYTTISSASQQSSTRWIRFHKETIDSIEIFWTYVHHVLCADAPEGHVPDELEEEASLDTKEILSYSWRGLKEARYVFISLRMLRSLTSTVCCSARLSPKLLSARAKMIMLLQPNSNTWVGFVLPNYWNFVIVVRSLPYPKHSQSSVAVASRQKSQHFVLYREYGIRCVVLSSFNCLSNIIGNASIDSRESRCYHPEISWYTSAHVGLTCCRTANRQRTLPSRHERFGSGNAR